MLDYYVDIHRVPRLAVDYEDTLEDPDRELRRVPEFLGYPLSADVKIDPSAVGQSAAQRRQ